MLNVDQRNILLQRLGYSDNDELADSIENLASEILEYTIIEKLESDSLRDRFFDLIDTDETGEQAMAFARENIPNLEELVTQRVKDELNKIKN